MSWLYFILLGAVAGWIAGKITKGKSFGLIGNIVVGIVGALIGGYVFDMLNISAGGGLIGSLVTAVAGALILLGIVSFINKR